MPATRSTARRRETQKSRQNVIRQDRGDYYKCNICGGLFSRYHNSYKRHVQLCKAQDQDLGDEEAQAFLERSTPTPQPYTFISSSEGVESELGAGSDVGMDTGYGAPIF